MAAKAVLSFLVTLFVVLPAVAQDCASCHEKVTPNIVSDWRLSKHSQSGIDCSVCHGDQHTSAGDVCRFPSS